MNRNFHAEKPASEPKCVNSILEIIGVNSLRLEGLHIKLNNLNAQYLLKNRPTFFLI